jgi:hypothetical protein
MDCNMMYEIARQRMADQQRLAEQRRSARQAIRARKAARDAARHGNARAEAELPAIPDYAHEMFSGAVQEEVAAQRRSAAPGWPAPTDR